MKKRKKHKASILQEKGSSTQQCGNDEGAPPGWTESFRKDSYTRRVHETFWKKIIWRNNMTREKLEKYLGEKVKVILFDGIKLEVI